MWFLFKRLRYIFIYYTCAFSCHRECAEVRGHLVEVDSPAIWGLDVRMASAHWPWGFGFSPYLLITWGPSFLPSRCVCGGEGGSERLLLLLERHLPSIPSVWVFFFCAGN